MPANEELPRGLALTAEALAGPSGITVTYPAIPGIAWVLTAIDAIAYSGSGSPGHYFLDVTTSMGTPAGKIVVENNAGVNAEGEYTWSGQAVSPVGAALTITISNVANVGSILNCNAYPV